MPRIPRSLRLPNDIGGLGRNFSADLRDAAAAAESADDSYESVFDFNTKHYDKHITEADCRKSPKESARGVAPEPAPAAEPPLKWAMERRAHAAGLRIEALIWQMWKFVREPLFATCDQYRIAPGQEKAAHEAGIPVQIQFAGQGEWHDLIASSPWFDFAALQSSGCLFRIKPTEEAQ